MATISFNQLVVVKGKNAKKIRKEIKGGESAFKEIKPIFEDLKGKEAAKKFIKGI